MPSVRRLVSLTAAAGLIATALLAVPVAEAAPRPAARAALAPISCETSVTGVLTNGKLVMRDLKNAAVTRQQSTALPLAYRVDSIYLYGSDAANGSHIVHGTVHGNGQLAKDVDITSQDTGTAPLKVAIVDRYRPSPTGRLFTNSGRYYTYGVAPNGALTRWTRFVDDAGNVGFDEPRVVRSGMAGLKTLSYMFTSKLSDGIRRDVLYATTSAGALLQIAVPWGTPGKPAVATIRAAGFAAFTSLSLSWCNLSGTIGSIIAVDRVHNEARWFTVTGQFHPATATLQRRGLVGVGYSWHFVCTD
jgi:hypothetical protein